jgi:cephalosporin hydroxylase
MKATARRFAQATGQEILRKEAGAHIEGGMTTIHNQDVVLERDRGNSRFIPSLRKRLKSTLTREQRKRFRRWIIALETVFPPLRTVRQAAMQRGWPILPEGRNWRTAVSPGLLFSFQDGAVNYRYRDIPMQKHPVEIALYLRLLWQIKPRTIIEIGSLAGGAAVWMGDMLNSFRIDGRVISVDLLPPKPSDAPPNVRFVKGDANDLGQALSSDFLQTLPRPWLIIEDASHDYRTTLSVLRFFDSLLQSGEYMIVEDAAIAELGQDSWHEGGAARAITQFVSERRSDFEIDTAYCDYYGQNVTGNPNGYLRKK